MFSYYIRCFSLHSKLSGAVHPYYSKELHSSRNIPAHLTDIRTAHAHLSVSIRSSTFVPVIRAAPFAISVTRDNICSKLAVFCARKAYRSSTSAMLGIRSCMCAFAGALKSRFDICKRLVPDSALPIWMPGKSKIDTRKAACAEHKGFSCTAFFCRTAEKNNRAVSFSSHMSSKHMRLPMHLHQADYAHIHGKLWQLRKLSSKLAKLKVFYEQTRKQLCLTRTIWLFEVRTAIFPVFYRRHLIILLKFFIKKSLILITHFLRNFRNRSIGIS